MPMQFVNSYRMAAAFARSLGEFCHSLDIDLNACVCQVGIGPQDFNDTTKFISLEKFTSLLQLLASEAKDDCFGIKFGAFFKLGDSGPFGFGLLNAPNLGESLLFYSHFMPLTADYAHFSLETGPKNTVVSWRYSPLLSNHYQYADMMATISIRQFRVSCGANWVPHSVSLMRRPPDDISLHHLYMGSNLHFEADENRIAIPNQSLLLENPIADRRLFELMKVQCEDALTKRMAKMPLEIQIRNAIVNRLGAEPVSLPQVADALGMSARNMQRLLKLKEMSFELILEESRKELSEILLKHQELSIADVAERVGYSATPAFARAIKKWYGLSPNQARRMISAKG